ncbi:8-oxo-dGTP pyrophosphatase MutT (NUDIX family) [Kineococcus radiotolerans]|uniref:8-oxo-dGTP pyrophosphatase MutT (NUDIX family) n=1 Tax=Kineococcus radiotolerans TaxID=131568 RepID=A0A7W4XX95_KINRA|nr:CoA pyrophosphatase [Kineococcus radiotolerans]MBB2900945.1 8-oxo-dGTP pyrophosphatase MutT (NUDIX family) [Kineococcus radiotolerans]
MSALPGWLQPLAARLPTVTAADLRWRADRSPDPGTAAAATAAASRPAAVLVLLAEGPDGPEVLLTERAGTLRQHSGQVAFPGGRSDPGDADAAATALREAEEETGLEPGGVSVLGQLPPLALAHSGHRVTCVVGHWHAPCPVGVVDPSEVARVERVPLAELFAEGAVRRVRGPGGPGAYVGPAFAVRGLLVWGFTAEVLVRVLDLGGLRPPPPATAVAELSLEQALDWAGAGA